MRALTGITICAATVLLMATGGCAKQRITWDLNGRLMSLKLNSPFPLELKRIEPGTFTMGSTPEAGARFSIPEDEKPSHEVRIDRPYFIAVHETTNEHFRRFDPKHDSTAALASLPEAMAADAGLEDLNADRNPVVGVSLAEAEAYCKWLSEECGLTVRLPTEAEWEFACRGGSDSAYCWGDARAESTKFANLAEAGTAEKLGGVEDPAPRDDGKRLTARVASFQANANGLYDMHGNVAEWCEDVYSANYNNAAPDGSANQTGSDNELHVVRGGSWASGMDHARSAARDALPASTEDAMTGFRIVVEMPDSVEEE
ncbi:MAG: SUMF1/EgtB/PvdO family nonheme iron enzyme [Planctomycetales bacterium]|nr:SUMF1/EgtB/PvdO family nonheme iron enzyme [bacterium]UNM09939.1 MAG: SUMF1/EgtB/PvdO family nonheme iron enzyme [Planctomycetales bacterium]